MKYFARLSLNGVYYDSIPGSFGQAVAARNNFIELFPNYAECISIEEAAA